MKGHSSSGNEWTFKIFRMYAFNLFVFCCVFFQICIFSELPISNHNSNCGWMCIFFLTSPQAHIQFILSHFFFLYLNHLVLFHENPIRSQSCGSFCDWIVTIISYSMSFLFRTCYHCFQIMSC